MIQRVLRKQIKKQQARHGKQNAQHVINTVLWKILMENGGSIKIPCSTLKQIPVTAAVMAKYDSATDSMTLIAGTRAPKIILPNNGLIAGGEDAV